MKLQNKKLAQEWFKRARSDFQYAQAGERETRRHHITCFLCHQAVEKILKGFLVGVGENPPQTHSLRSLAAKTKELFPKIDWDEKGIRRLDAFYIPSRYPGPLEQEFIAKDAQEALSIAEKFVGLVVGIPLL